MIRPLEIPDVSGRLYAVGDIHGRKTEVEILLAHLENSEKLSKDDIVLFIGDYVDRGQESRDVVDLLIRFKARHQQTIFLRGNHEDMLLGFLGLGGHEGNVYLVNGGALTLTSYGIDQQGSAPELREALQQRMPPEHMAFFQNLEGYVIAGDYVFAHAGLNPLRDLRMQIAADLFWIREDFIHNNHYFRRTIVFGHTPYEEVLFHLPYKIGIDTGLVYGNALTCIEVKEKRVLQVKAGDKAVKTAPFPEEAAARAP